MRQIGSNSPRWIMPSLGMRASRKVSGVPASLHLVPLAENPIQFLVEPAGAITLQLMITPATSQTPTATKVSGRAAQLAPAFVAAQLCGTSVR